MPRRHATARALTRRSRASASRAATTTFVREGENVTYRVDHGERAYALRIHRPGYQTPASVRSEIAWMEALRAAGVATPEVVRGASGDVVEQAETPEGPRLVALFGWVEGESFARLDEPALWERLGRPDGAAARPRPRASTRPPGFVRQAWDDEGMVGARPLWGDPLALGAWDADAGARAGGGARDGAPSGCAPCRARPTATASCTATWRSTTCWSRPTARRWSSTSTTAAGRGTSWELAVALFPFDGEPGFDERRDALVRGYRAVAPLPDDVLAELPTFVMARRIVTLGWLFLHPAHRARRGAARVAAAHACGRRSSATWPGPAPSWGRVWVGRRTPCHPSHRSRLRPGCGTRPASRSETDP